MTISQEAGPLALPSMVSEDLLDLMGDTGTIDSVICPLKAEEARLETGLCLGDSSASDMEVEPIEVFFPLELKYKVGSISVCTYLRIVCFDG